jgi:tryptophan synthase alpha chain
VRAGCDLPVGIGFGVTDAAKASFVAARAEAVIVGAAIARVIERTRGDGPAAVAEAVGAFADGLAQAIARVEK